MKASRRTYMVALGAAGLVLVGSMVGAVAVLMNARYRAPEVRYVVENADLAAVVTNSESDDFVDFVARLTEALSAPAVGSKRTRGGAAKTEEAPAKGGKKAAAAAAAVEEEGSEEEMEEEKPAPRASRSTRGGAAAPAPAPAAKGKGRK